MRLIIQRVKRATLKVHDRVFSEIDEGLLVLVGITHEDQEEDLDLLANKITYFGFQEMGKSSYFCTEVK